MSTLKISIAQAHIDVEFLETRSSFLWLSKKPSSTTKFSIGFDNIESGIIAALNEINARIRNLSQSNVEVLVGHSHARTGVTNIEQHLSPEDAQTQASAWSARFWGATPEKFTVRAAQIENSTGLTLMIVAIESAIGKMIGPFCLANKAKFTVCEPAILRVIRDSIQGPDGTGIHVLIESNEDLSQSNGVQFIVTKNRAPTAVFQMWVGRRRIDVNNAIARIAESEGIEKFDFENIMAWPASLQGVA